MESGRWRRTEQPEMELTTAVLTMWIARSRIENFGEGWPTRLASPFFLLLTDSALGQRTCAAAISIRLRPVRLAP